MDENHVEIKTQEVLQRETGKDEAIAYEVPEEITVDLEKDEKGYYLVALQGEEKVEIERRYLTDIECQIMDFEPWVIQGVPLGKQAVIKQDNETMEKLQEAISKGMMIGRADAQEARAILRRTKRRMDLLNDERFQLPHEVKSGNRKMRREMAKIVKKLRKPGKARTIDNLEFPLRQTVTKQVTADANDNEDGPQLVTVKQVETVGYIIAMMRTEDGEVKTRVRLLDGEVVEGTVESNGNMTIPAQVETISSKEESDEEATSGDVGED